MYKNEEKSNFIQGNGVCLLVATCKNLCEGIKSEEGSWKLGV